MQTFLPYPSFTDTAAVLDGARLGKQRVETLQILRVLQLPDYGWQNHPARAATQLARRRAAAPVAPQPADRQGRRLLPAAVPDTPRELDYFWPPPDEVPAEDPTLGLNRLWVIRPATELALGRCVHLGLVGFGLETGVLEDAAGRGFAELRSLVPAGPQRNNRALRALAALTGELRPGSQIAVPILAGAALLAGEVTGDYAFVAKDKHGLNHRRSVRWHRVVARSAARPFGALQDVRPLFEIAVAE